MTDYPDYQTPQAHANAIAITGVPLLSLATSLFSMGAAQSVASGADFTVPGGPFTVNQIGYEFFLQVSGDAASLLPVGLLSLTWSDSVSGNVVAVDHYSVIGGSAAFQRFSCTGPTKGDTLAVKFHNYDATQAQQFQMSMVENSRVFVRDDLRQITTVAVPLISNGVYDQQAGILLATNPTIGAGATVARLIAFYSGLVNVYAFGPLAYRVNIAMEDGALGTLGGNNLWAASVLAAGGGDLYQPVALPRMQCVLSIQNNGTISQPFQCVIAISEQPA